MQDVGRNLVTRSWLRTVVHSSVPVITPATWSCGTVASNSPAPRSNAAMAPANRPRQMLLLQRVGSLQRTIANRAVGRTSRVQRMTCMFHESRASSAGIDKSCSWACRFSARSGSTLRAIPQTPSAAMISQHRRGFCLEDACEHCFA